MSAENAPPINEADSLIDIAAVSRFEGVTERAIQLRIQAGRLQATERAGKGRGGKVLMVRPSNMSAAAYGRYLIEQAQTAERGAPVAAANLAVFQPEQVVEARRRRDAALRMVALGSSRTTAQVDALASEIGVSRSRLYEFERLYRTHLERCPNGSDALTPFLPPAPRRSDRGTSRTFDAAALDYLKGTYLTNRLNLTDAYRAVEVQAVLMGWRIGSYATAARWIQQNVTKTERIYATEGVRGVKEKVAPPLLRDWSAVQVNAWWVLDHHQFDVAVRDGSRVYRPWLTAVLDMRTRGLMGWALSEVPNSDSIGQALKMAILPKQDRGLIGYGIPGTLYVDNGKDFRGTYIMGGAWKEKQLGRVEMSEMVRGLVDHLGSQVVFALPYNPESKPVERFFSTLAKQFSEQQPGYLGRHTKERAEIRKALGHDPAEMSDRLLDLNDLMTRFTAWVGTYHDRGHRGAGMDGQTPRQVWDAARAAGWVPLQVANERTLDVLLLRREKRKVQRGMIQFGGERHFYTSPALTDLNGRYVTIGYDRHDLSRLQVFSGAEWICTAYPVTRTVMGQADAEVRDGMAAQRRTVKEVAEQVRGVQRLGRDGDGKRRQRRAPEVGAAVADVPQAAAVEATEHQPLRLLKMTGGERTADRVVEEVGRRAAEEDLKRASERPTLNLLGSYEALLRRAASGHDTHDHD